MGYLKPGQVSEVAWARGYQLWLRGGYTLEQVGQLLGLRPHSARSVSIYLQKLYGNDATNPHANSFLRSLAEDYPESDWVKALESKTERNTGRFFSRRVERTLATKGVARTIGNRSNEMKYRIAYQESITNNLDPWSQFEQHSVITMSQLLWFIDAIISIIGELIIEVDV